MTCSDVSQIASHKGLPFRESLSIPLPKGRITKGELVIITFCNKPRGGFYPPDWSRLEEGVVYLQNPTTRKSLRIVISALKWPTRVQFCIKYEILHQIEEICSQYRLKLMQENVLNALFSWDTAE